MTEAQQFRTIETDIPARMDRLLERGDFKRTSRGHYGPAN